MGNNGIILSLFGAMKAPTYPAMTVTSLEVLTGIRRIRNYLFNFPSTFKCLPFFPPLKKCLFSLHLSHTIQHFPIFCITAKVLVEAVIKFSFRFFAIRLGWWLNFFLLLFLLFWRVQLIAIFSPRAVLLVLARAWLWVDAFWLVVLLEWGKTFSKKRTHVPRETSSQQYKRKSRLWIWYEGRI